MFELKETLTYKIYLLILARIKEFLITLGSIGKDLWRVLGYLLKCKIRVAETIEQSKRFAYDSLPISLAIVGMTSIIIAMQLAPELSKQGGADYTGMLSGLVMVRELAVVMSGFAIISMVGSSFASEIASMSVTEQINAMKVLNVDPVEYLIVPRFTAGYARSIYCLCYIRLILCRSRFTLLRGFKYIELCNITLAWAICS